MGGVTLLVYMPHPPLRYIFVTLQYLKYKKWCKILPAQLLGIRQPYILLKYTIIGIQIHTRLLFDFQTYFYLQDHFGPQIIMHLRVCSLVISLDYSKLTDSLHKGLMCVVFSLVQACWHGFGKAVRLVRQRLFILMYVCFPLLILR